MKKIIIAILSLLILCSCAKTETVSENTVYTTFYAMYDFTKAIAGDKLDIVQLVPSGSGPHDFEPTAKNIASLSKSKAFIYCGSIDLYAKDIVDVAEKSGVMTLDTSKNITLDGTDPHIWLSPDNALEQYNAITDMLSEMDSNNKDYYISNLENVKKQIDDIKSDINEISNNSSKKDIVVSHAAYSYLCKELDINEVSLEGSNGEGSDPTAKQMADIISFVQDNNIKVVFAEKGESDKIAQAVAEQTNAKVLYLDPFEADVSNESYYNVMKNNLELIKEAIE